MTLNDVVSNWNTIGIPAGVSARPVAAPFRSTRQLIDRAQLMEKAPYRGEEEQMRATVEEQRYRTKAALMAWVLGALRWAIFIQRHRDSSRRPRSARLGRGSISPQEARLTVARHRSLAAVLRAHRNTVADHDRVVIDEHLLDDGAHDSLPLHDIERLGRRAQTREKRREGLG